MEKINIAELLKDCPGGMELDCTMWDNLYFDRVEDDLIHCYYELNGFRNSTMFLKDGCYTAHKLSKCVIFPKGKTTWEGFVPPIEFKDGDVVVSSFGNIHILKNRSTSYIHVDFTHSSKGCFCKTLTTCVNAIRLATEEEKQKLFDAIKAKGYKWNAETKTLEKLPKFKVGDVIANINRKHLHCDSGSGEISQITDDKYIFIDGSYIHIQDQDEWELVPNKFDINTLKPFDKVLVRDNNAREWQISFFSHCNGLENYKYSCINGCGYAQCIPYEQNEHLLGTTNDCDDFYKTWEK